MKYVQGPCAGTRCLCIKEEHAFCSGYTKVACDRGTQVWGKRTVVSHKHWTNVAKNI